MKKKVLALVCAAVMVMGLSVTAMAEGSITAGDVAGGNSSTGSSSTGKGSPTTAAVVEDSGTISVPGNSKQTFAQSSLDFFAKDLVVEGGVVKAVSMATAEEAISEAVKVYGDDTFIAGIVDIDVPGATFPYNLTIKCSNVWAGQTVTVLHKVNGVWERLTPSKVADNSLTVTVNSFSPFAIVIDTNPSPKTGDIVLMVSGLAGLFATGTVFTRKKR